MTRTNGSCKASRKRNGNTPVSFSDAIVAAIRPLRVEELAEILESEFGPNGVPNLVEGWRPENPEEALLSACSTLIVIDDQGSKIVQI